MALICNHILTHCTDIFICEYGLNVIILTLKNYFPIDWSSGGVGCLWY